MDMRWPDTMLPDAAMEPVAYRAWFSASTPSGTLRLAVTSRDGLIRHAADAAIALHTCEPLLSGLEEWTGETLDWRWAGDEDTDESPDGEAARLVWRGGDATLACPWAWLRRHAAPTGTWVGELDLPAVEATLVAARMHLPAEALLALEAGGAVIVPASLRPSWHGVLRATDEDSNGTAGAVVALSGVDDATPDRPGFAPGVDAATALLPYGDPSDRLCELRLAVPQPVPVDGLAGWRKGPLGPAGPVVSLWLCRNAAGKPRLLAIGRLMPWGDGWALAIETVGDRGTT